jgi:hypothetical protein
VRPHSGGSRWRRPRALTASGRTAPAVVTACGRWRAPASPRAPTASSSRFHAEPDTAYCDADQAIDIATLAGIMRDREVLAGLDRA